MLVKFGTSLEDAKDPSIWNESETYVNVARYLLQTYIRRMIKRYIIWKERYEIF